MGGRQSSEIPRHSPLGCILAHWGEIGGPPGGSTNQKTLIKFCTRWWPLYKLDGGEKWPVNGSLEYDTLLQLMLFLRREKKWDETIYADMFFYLREHPEFQRDCGVRAPSDPMVLALEKENKAKNKKQTQLKRCCSACSIGQRCLKLEEIKDLPEFYQSPGKLQEVVTESSENNVGGFGSGSNSDSDTGVSSQSYAQGSPVARRTRGQQANAPASQISFRKPSGAQVDRTISGVIDILHSHQNQGTSCLDSPHQSQEDFSKRMETRISGTPEAQAVSIIVICLLVNTIEGWEGNMYLNVSQELALQTNLSNCWICTELPRGQMRTPLFGVASMNWTWGPSDWVTTSDSNFHNCQHGKDSSESLGTKFDLLIVDPSRTLFVESNESSENKVGWRNLTGLGCSWNYSSPGEVSGANPWVQGNGCTSSKESRLDVVGAGVALLSHTNCLLPYGYWWLCGDGHARKSLPPKWTGVCTAGYLTPQITVHHEILPRGYWRTLWRRHRRTANPLVRYNTGYHSFVRALFPALGVAQLEKAIVNISATMEVIANSAADAVQNLQVEVKSASSVSLQNRLALDIITAEMGGVCTLINTTCCTYVDRSGQIKTDVQNIWEQGKVLHEVSKDDTSYGLSDLWEELTSWMPNIRWLKQLLLGIVMIVLLIILLLVLIEIIMCTGKSSVESYHKYKNYKLRHELETRHYFKKI
ncbi:uncharacterized protein [Melanerpes formicivorus]|uniref:uncharacterized protein isoform X1 n=2 Tax=Melanerpes formicivorus TaxID=211600 RepID=UPI00358E8039